MHSIKSLYKYNNINEIDIYEIDKFIDLNIKDKKKYIQTKENELIKIFEYLTEKCKFIDDNVNLSLTDLLCNPNIDLDYVKKLNTGDFDWQEFVSRNPNITIENIFEDRKQWNWQNLTSNQGITIKDIVNNNYNRYTYYNNFDYRSKHIIKKFKHLKKENINITGNEYYYINHYFHTFNNSYIIDTNNYQLNNNSHNNGDNIDNDNNGDNIDNDNIDNDNANNDNIDNDNANNDNIDNDNIDNDADMINERMINSSYDDDDMIETFWHFNETIKENKNITIQHIIYYNWKLDWNDISQNKYVDINFIEQNINKINMYHISSNCNITFEFVLKHIDKNFDWRILSANPVIKLHHIENTLYLPWRWDGISYNPNLTIDFIKKYKNKNWCWRSISYNPGITMKDIENNLNFPWVMECILINPNLTLEFIKKYENKLFTANYRTITIRVHNIFINEFIHDEFVYNKSLNNDIQIKKNSMFNILNKYLYKDLIIFINDYTHYN